MDKKELKFYESPAMDVVEMKLKAHLLEGSGDSETIDDDDIL